MNMCIYIYIYIFLSKKETYSYKGFHSTSAAWFSY